MAQIESNKIPITYNERTTTGSNVSTNKKLYTVFDTELKKTFVYDDAFTLGSRKPLATIDSSGKLVPFQENGTFIASQGLRDKLSNDQNLKNALQSTTRNAVRDYIGLGDPSLIRNVTNLQIDQAMGTTASANNAEPAAAPPAAAASSPSPSSNPAAPATTTISEPTEFISDDIIKDSNNVRSKYDNYVYPENLNLGKQDYVKFTMYRYKPKGLTSSQTLTEGISKTGSTNKKVDQKGNGKGSVILPIQSPAADNNRVGWGDGRLTGVEAAAFNLAQSAIDGGLEAGVARAGTFLDDVLKGPKSGQYKSALGYYFAQQAAQVNDVFARATGGILNPNLELLFQAPELRSFNFTFKLSARDQPEADMIRKIIRFFKQGMSVKKSQSALFLKSPDIFEITYFRGGGGEHKSLNKFKTCALKTFSVDYTPLGSYMTYDDPAATMVAYTISMEFQEIDPIYDDDYGSEDEIGY